MTTKPDSKEPALQLPSSVSSPQDLTGLIIEVKECAKWFAHETVKKQVKAGEMSAAPVLSPAANELIHALETKGPLSKESLASLIETLEQFAKNAPSISITLSAPPNVGIKKTLVGWCRENIAPDVLVTFQFNSTLLGGMVVRSGSQIFDWSFRRKLLAARDKFPEVLRHVR